MNGQSIIDKLWSSHRVMKCTDAADLLYIDRIFLHERTGSIALQSLGRAGFSVRCPSRVFATMDHIVDTQPGRTDATRVPNGTEFIQATRESARAAGITLFDIGDKDQGIAHVVSPELGIALPGLTLVCPDSHTGTLGGLGALAWGIGSTDAGHALATQTLVVKRPQQMRVRFNGSLRPGVTAKDLILRLIAQYGAGGGKNMAIEFSGNAITQLPVEGRLTLCNMAVEFGAWTGVIAPDDKTIEYVHGKRFAPQGAAWDSAVVAWRALPSDETAVFDAQLEVDISELGPQVTWGTSPQHVTGVGGRVPSASANTNASNRDSIERALQYMQLEPGQPLASLAVDAAFIGSCTNARLSDLREAAAILDGRKVAPGVRALCVPGSSAVKRAAEAEGLDAIFRAAGFEWRESGCSLCFYAGGEGFEPGARVISSTNRNFEGRQGPATRTHLASPATVAASAVLGRIGGAEELQ
tara:strand:+ start:14008 stop:15414 length:1407 start_codon:yes stop_codon:yes gene_type:complete